MFSRRLLLVGLLIASLVNVAAPQLQPYPPSAASVYKTPTSYSEYYAEQRRQYPAANPNVRNYTIDRYYYHSPTLSPYLNLGRRTNSNNLNNYHRFVRPEVDRRSAATPAPRMTAPSTTMPNTMAYNMPAPSAGHLPTQSLNPYFNQYYNVRPLTPTPPPPPLSPKPLPKLFP